MYKYTNYEIRKILSTYVYLYINGYVHNIRLFKASLDYLNHMEKVEDRPAKLIVLLTKIRQQTFIII